LSLSPRADLLENRRVTFGTVPRASGCAAGRFVRRLLARGTVPKTRL